MSSAKHTGFWDVRSMPATCWKSTQMPRRRRSTLSASGYMAHLCAQIAGGSANCVHDVSDGGLCALAEMCLPQKSAARLISKATTASGSVKTRAVILSALHRTQKRALKSRRRYRRPPYANWHDRRHGIDNCGCHDHIIGEIATVHENWFPNLMGGR